MELATLEVVLVSACGKQSVGANESVTRRECVLGFGEICNAPGLAAEGARRDTTG